MCVYIFDLLIPHGKKKSHPPPTVLYCHLWQDWLYHVFPHCLLNHTIFEGGGWTWNVCFYCLYNFSFKHFLFGEEFSKISQIYVGLHAKYPLFMSHFNQTRNFSIFEKSLNVNFHESSFCGSRICPCRWMDGQTDMTKLTAAFCNWT